MSSCVNSDAFVSTDLSAQIVELTCRPRNRCLCVCANRALHGKNNKLKQRNISAFMFSGGSSPQHLGGTAPMASAVARAYIGSLGAAPLKLKHFWFLDIHNGRRKFAHFSTIWKHKEIRYICYLCKKITGGHETGGLEQNWGGGLCFPAPA